jgi:hypothetical protein
MRAVIISINPPYTDKILNGEKKFEFRKKIINAMQDIHDETYIYIYETKNKGGKGRIIATCRAGRIYEPAYLKDINAEKMPCYPKFYMDEREALNSAVDDDWCRQAGISRFDLRPFTPQWEEYVQHCEDIGEDGHQYNYAISLLNITPCNLSLEDLHLKRPPQNMQTVSGTGFEQKETA